MVHVWSPCTCTQGKAKEMWERPAEPEEAQEKVPGGGVVDVELQWTFYVYFCWEGG